MIAQCPTCQSPQVVNLIFHAEREYNTETEEDTTDDVDFSHAECANCHTWLGDDADMPEVRKLLVKLGWRKD